MAYEGRREGRGEGRRFDSRGGGRGGGFSRPPVNVGEEIDVTIEAVGEKGDGVAKKNGFVLFVPNTKEGERIKVRVTKVLKKVGFAEKIGEAGEKTEEAPAAEKSEESESAPEESEDFGEEKSEESESEEEEEQY